MSSKKFSIKTRIKSFKYAFEGLAQLFKKEHNARIHLVVTILVVILGFFLKINPSEWIAILIVIGLVFITELLNTAIERLSDKITTGYDKTIKQVKDYSAAAVLVSAITAVIVGGIIFVPKVLKLF